MFRSIAIILLPAIMIPAAAVSGEAAAADYPRVHRTFMPDSGPSAFAVELSPALTLCYDPLRGGVNRIWKGGIDLSPTLRAKINAPAEPEGPAFYRESVLQPLRLGDAGAEADRRFKGYRYVPGAVVFEFTLRGVPVTETLRLAEDGGVAREFGFPEGGGPAFFTLESQPDAEVTVRGGREVSPNLWRFEEGEPFTLLIRP